MKDLQVVAFGMNPLQGSFYGVEASCASTADKIAAFHGHGYLQLQSSNAAKPSAESSMGFTFKTRVNDAVLLYVLPTSYVRLYPPPPTPPTHRRHPYYCVVFFLAFAGV